MRRSLGFSIVVLVLACPIMAVAQNPVVWLDATGDGLPDGSPGVASLGQNVNFDIWFNTDSYTWTGYQAWVSRGAAFSFVSGTYIISGGTNFTIDNFSNPTATGFSGFGYPGQHGTMRISNLVLRTALTGLRCAVPIIDSADPYATFCVLSTALTYRLFANSSGTCWDVSSGTATQASTWGQIKGLFE